MQGYIWSYCLQQLKFTNQRLLACDSPISDAEAAAGLQSIRGAEGLMEHPRTWFACLCVSSFVVDEIERLARQMEPPLAAKPTK